jgi:DNA polymerase III delta prime subunit
MRFGEVCLFNAVIEQYTKNVRFCMICNYVGKIIPALQSRCTRFRFAPLEMDQIDDRLKFVIESEGYIFLIKSEDQRRRKTRFIGTIRRRYEKSIEYCTVCLYFLRLY